MLTYIASLRLDAKPLEALEANLPPAIPKTRAITAQRSIMSP